MSHATGPAGHEGVETRAGYVALVGRPNVGKSTLLNAMVGEKLSIVTPRAQTTRERVTGIFSGDGAQIVFVDTPGLLEPRYLLQSSMLAAALGALEESDLVLLILDASRSDGAFPEGEALDRLKDARERLFVAINKSDASPAERVTELVERVRESFGVEPRIVSALSGEGVAELRSALIESLPNSPFYFPEDDIAIQSVRFFVSELIRETVFEEYEEEVPYSTAVRVEEFREAEDPIFIRAVIFVERESQKAIIIGRGGSGIRRLGQRAREKIEAFLDHRVFLDLWVKAMPRWRKKRGSLAHLGYTVPQIDGAGKASSRRGGSAARGRAVRGPRARDDGGTISRS